MSVPSLSRTISASAAASIEANFTNEYPKLDTKKHRAEKHGASAEIIHHSGGNSHVQNSWRQMTK